MKRSQSIVGAVILAIFTCLLLLWIGPSFSRAESISIALPPYQVRWAASTNFGERVKKDVFGTALKNRLIVVLHETVGSAESTINLIQNPDYTKNGNQVSYHALIRLDGTIVYMVPFEHRAFGAGNSVFMGVNGPESVQTNAQVSSSVNNFALHFSLESPPDGRNNNDSHSGYTKLQYRSLAWLVKYTKVPEARITYHKAVDLSRTRKDPRSFDRDYFFKLLRA
jgi:hypothetical protein